VLAAVAFVLLIGVTVQKIFDSTLFRRAAVRWIETAAADRGLDLEIGRAEWDILPPRTVMHDVTLAGPGVRAQIDRLEADLARVRVARRTLELGTVAAGGVTVRLTDIPRSESEPGSSLIRVAIRHLDLSDVTFEGRNLPGRLEVDLEGLDIAWTKEDEVPSGFIAIERAAVAVPGLNPFTFALQTRIEIDDGIRFPNWKIDGDGLRIGGSGRIAEGSVRLDLSADIDLTDLDRVVRTNGLLQGDITVSARIDTGAEALVQAQLSSPGLSAAGFPVEDVRASLSVENDSVSGVLETARFNGGELSGRYRLAHFSGPTRPHSVRATGRGVSLNRLLADIGVPTAGLDAAMDVNVELDWNGRSINRGGGGFAVAEFTPAGGSVPLEGRLDIELTHDGLLQFAADDLAIGASVVDWQGPLTLGSWEPNWSIRASPARLSEVLTLVNGFVGQEVLPPWVDGSGDLQVTMSGPWQRLVIGAQLDARPLTLLPIVFDQVVTEATIRESKLQLGPTRFRIDDGNGEIDGTLTWDRSAYPNQLDLGIRGFRIPISTIARWLGVEGQAEGVVSFTGGLRGPLQSPRGSWAVGFDGARLIGQDLGGGTATLDLADGRFDGRGLTFENGLEGTAWWDVAGGVTGGRFLWPQMPLLAAGDTATRLLGDSADLDLTFELPRDGPATGRLVAVGPETLFEVDATDASVRIFGEAADSATVDATLRRVPSGGLRGDGFLRLAAADRLVAHLFPDSEIPIEGTGGASFEVDWPPDELPTVAGTVGDLDLQLENSRIRLLEPSSFRLSPDGAAFEGLHVGVRDEDLFARLAITTGGELSGNVAGTLDALLLRFLIPEWEPAGRATGVVEILGTADGPKFEGVAEINQGSFRLPGSQTILSGVNGTILLSADEVVLDGVDFRFLQGRGRATGRIGQRDGAIDLSLDGTAEGMRYTVLPDLTAGVSGSWRLVGPVDALELSGDITVDEMGLRSKEDIATLLLKWFGEDKPPPADAGGIQLDLRVAADETIELRNPSLRLVGSAALDVSGTTNRPGLVGTIEFNEGGGVTLQTLRYEVERASFTFSDPDLIDPFIDIKMRTWIQNYDISLRISGTQDRLVPSVSSNPPLTEDQIFGLMAVGRRTESVGGTGAMGVFFATSILSGQLASELDRRAGFSLPVDQVRVDPFAETDSSDTGGARVTLVKQINKSWTVTVQSNLSGARDPVFVSRWYIAPGIFVEASRDIEGSYGLDLFLRRPY
jgi:autotransporter translocation and assembly factor TamB